MIISLTSELAGVEHLTFTHALTTCRRQLVVGRVVVGVVSVCLELWRILRGFVLSFSGLCG